MISSQRKAAVPPDPFSMLHLLNYKKLPYKTMWLQVYEIEPVAKKVSAKPTKVKPNGCASSLYLYNPLRQKDEITLQ